MPEFLPVTVVDLGCEIRQIVCVVGHIANIELEEFKNSRRHKRTTRSLTGF